MGVEIERKFLVTQCIWGDVNGISMRQGYLNLDPMRTVRIRVAGENAFLTIKGKSQGCTRAEFEYPVPLKDGEEMLALCEGALIEKVRRKISFAGLTFEVDEFSGANAGLVVAEVELDSENQVIALPHWIGKEVTDDARYYNSNLVGHPFSMW